jgi:hypothetical protein
MQTDIQTASCTRPPTYVIPYKPTQDIGVPITELGLTSCPTAPTGLISITAEVPELLTAFPGFPISNFTTKESNNLTPTFARASSIVPACFEGECWIWYTSMD